MASIYESSPGRWTVQWSAGRDRTGKFIRDSRTFSSHDRAIAHKVAVEDNRVGTGADSLKARALAWVDDRLAIGAIGEKTAVGYREKLGAWGRLLGNAPYKSISPADLDRAFARLAQGETPTGRVPSPRTLHHYRAVLRAFFKAMVKRREVTFNPVDALETPRGLKDRTRRAPTRDELLSIIDAADTAGGAYGQLGFIIRLSAHIGLRRGEVCALQWSDVDLGAMSINIARAATQPTGRAVTVKAPKSDAGIRRISFTVQTRDLLLEQRKRIAALRLRAGTAWADNDLVVSDPFGQLLDLELLSRAAGNARNTAGVSSDVSPIHGARHYALTSLFKAGVDSLTIRKRAGHASARSTETYIHPDEADDQAAARASRASLL